MKTVQCSHGVSVYLKPPAEANTVFLDPHDKSQKGCKCKLSLHDSRVTYSTPHPPQTRQFASLSFTNQGGHQNSPGSTLQCSSLNEHDLARAPTPTPAPSPLGVSLHWLSLPGIRPAAQVFLVRPRVPFSINTPTLPPHSRHHMHRPFL